MRRPPSVQSVVELVDHPPLHNRREADIGEEVRLLREWGTAGDNVTHPTPNESSHLAEDEPIHQETGETRV